MPDTKLRPTSTMKSKDKSSEQRFGHVNVTNPNSYLHIIFIKLLHNKWKFKKNRIFEVFIFKPKKQLA